MRSNAGLWGVAVQYLLEPPTRVTAQDFLSTVVSPACDSDSNDAMETKLEDSDNYNMQIHNCK